MILWCDADAVLRRFNADRPTFYKFREAQLFFTESKSTTAHIFAVVHDDGHHTMDRLKYYSSNFNTSISFSKVQRYSKLSALLGTVTWARDLLGLTSIATVPAGEPVDG
jgi:hypothetical protein